MGLEAESPQVLFPLEKKKSECLGHGGEGPRGSDFAQPPLVEEGFTVQTLLQGRDR